MGRENAGEMKNIDSFCTTGGPWMCGGFPGKTRRNRASRQAAAGECGRIDDCRFIPAWGRCSRQWNSSGQLVEITQKILEGAVWLSSGEQWNLLKNAPHEVVEYRWNWSLLKSISRLFPGCGWGGGGREIHCHWLVHYLITHPPTPALPAPSLDYK